MNTHTQLGLVLILTVAFLPSCALQKRIVALMKRNTVGPIVRNEGKKPMEAGEAFIPSQISSYFFYVDGPKPPLVAATLPSGSGCFAGVRTTAYCHDEADHLIYGRKNAVGTMLKYGSERSAAADWSRYPVGTKFRIASEPEIVYVVDDYGSALVGTGTIDLYKPSRGQMNEWGVRHVDIEVIQWGSFERSRNYLESRTRYPHVRQMFFDIQRRLGGTNVGNRPGPITAMVISSTTWSVRTI